MRTAAARSTIRADSARSTWSRRDGARRAAVRGDGPGAARGTASTAPIWRRARGRTAPIKALLLDQRIVAGLGNIYVCEALHMAGIAPREPAAQSRGARLAGWSAAMKAVLLAAIEAGGSSLRDYARPSASSAISRSSGGSTAGKGRPAIAARRFGGAPTRAVRPSSARAASALRLTCGRSLA